MPDFAWFKTLIKSESSEFCLLSILGLAGIECLAIVCAVRMIYGDDGGDMNEQNPADRLVTASLRISPQERRKLERLAVLEERSVSQVARRLLRKQLSLMVEADK